LKIILVSGTEGKRSLAEYICDGLDDSCLLAFGGSSESGAVKAEDVDGARLVDALEASGVLPAGAVMVLETNKAFKQLECELAVFVTDAPLEHLEPSAGRAGRRAEIVLVKWGPLFEGTSELSLEGEIKAATGARKVLIFDDDESRCRAFRKVLDVALSRVGGEQMPEDIPQEVLEAVKREAVEGKIPCARAQALAEELGVPIPVVGRALDLLKIKIIRGQLGCF
jgi:hypothetical protein